MNPKTQRKLLRGVKLVLLTLQVVIVVLLIGYTFSDIFSALSGPEKDLPFEEWYGNWPAVFATSIFFLLFLFFLTRPRRPKEWKGAGLSAAFFISLFTEMYGIPLTIYVLAPILEIEPTMFACMKATSGRISLRAPVSCPLVLECTW